MHTDHMTATRYRLAACAEVLYQHLDFTDRVRELAKVGVASTMWSWNDKAVDQLASASLSIAGMSGHVSGNLIDPDQRETYLDGVAHSLAAAARLGCDLAVLHPTEILEGGRIATPVEVTTDEMRASAYEGLCRAADLASDAGVTLLLENLNVAVDHPGAPLATASEVIEMVKLVGSDHLGICLDLYHAQVDGENVVDLLRLAGSSLKEVQIADVPGRGEPGTGELQFGPVVEQLARIEFAGLVTLEAWPVGTSEQAVDAFLRTFGTAGMR